MEEENPLPGNLWYRDSLVPWPLCDHKFETLLPCFLIVQPYRPEDLALETITWLVHQELVSDVHTTSTQEHNTMTLYYQKHSKTVLESSSLCYLRTVFGVEIKSFPIARSCPETFHRTSHPRRYLLGPVLRKQIPWNLVNKNYTPEWLTWNLNMFSPARGDSFWKTIMFRFHVNFPGRICGCFFHGWSPTSQLSWNTQFFLMASRQTKRKMMKMVRFFLFF